MNNIKTITILHCIMLATDELFLNDEQLREGCTKKEIIELACQYGGKFKITKKDVEELLNLSLTRILELKD